MPGEVSSVCGSLYVSCVHGGASDAVGSEWSEAVKKEEQNDVFLQE